MPRWNVVERTWFERLVYQWLAGRCTHTHTHIRVRSGKKISARCEAATVIAAAAAAAAAATTRPATGPSDTRNSVRSKWKFNRGTRNLTIDDELVCYSPAQENRWYLVSGFGILDWRRCGIIRWMGREIDRSAYCWRNGLDQCLSTWTDKRSIGFLGLL